MQDYRNMVQRLMSLAIPVADKMNPLRAGLSNPTSGLEGARGYVGGGRGLAVAMKRPDGSIRIGKPGQIHSDLIAGEDLGRLPDNYSLSNSMGFALPDGRFVTRTEAARLMNRRGGLDTSDF